MIPDKRGQVMDGGTLPLFGLLITTIAIVGWNAVERPSFGEGGLISPPDDPVVIVDGTPILDGVAASGGVEQTVGMLLIGSVLVAFGYVVGRVRAQEAE